MIGICAAKLLVPLLVAWQWSGQPDALRYVEAAKMWRVPPSVLLASKWAETRRSMRNTEVSGAGAHGAMQVMPRYWHWQCGRVLGARYYARNIHCGALIWRYYLSRCSEDVVCGGFGYVGGDSTYAKEVGFHSLVLELKAQAIPWLLLGTDSSSAPPPPP